MINPTTRDTACLLFALVFAATANAADIVRVMTFNVWGDGHSGKQPLAQTAAVIRAAKADIVGLQEAQECVPQLAQLLGWNYAKTDRWTGRGTAVLSRFELEHKPEYGWGVRVKADFGPMWVFNVHFSAAPYQPYQLLNIPYGDGRFISTEKEAIVEANAARGAEVRRLLEETQRSTSDDDIVFVTGDFNEPSHRDWTTRAAAVGLHPLRIRYPTTKRVEAQGFVDAFRTKHSNEVSKPGTTWTPLTKASDPKDHHDRIDFVFGRGRKLKIRNAQIVGEAEPAADIVVNPWPSDHRAVVVEYSVTQ